MSGVAGKVVFLVQRIGPYHDARLRAWAGLRDGRVEAIEFRPGDDVYAWARVDRAAAYGRRETRSPAELTRELQGIDPAVVVCVGYADPEIHVAMRWALDRGIPLVTCSDSTYRDEPRRWWKESLKRRLVAAFSAGLVAGSRAREYLGRLGLRDEQVFAPWDVVDNAFFAQGGRAALAQTEECRQRLGLPRHFFLCVARFVPKKNLIRLLLAYAAYRKSAIEPAWSLVLSGAGPQEAMLRELTADLSMATEVFFPGFVQYPDLPACYALAGALVLPSTVDQWGLVVNEAMATGLPVLVSNRCGCAPELVHEGENGFTFDPDDTERLAALLARIASLDEVKRTAMGERSREIIGDFTPEAFGKNLEAAIEHACRLPQPAISWMTRAIVGCLARKPPMST
jgi:glycosyltransferase involved in cell wall biosynthesis